MKHSGQISIMLLVVIFALFTVSCTNNAELPDSSSNTTAPSTVTTNTEPAKEQTQSTAINVNDMTGRQVTLNEPAERIVVLDAADCEILYAIGAGDMIVGRGEYCNYPPEVNDVPSVQSGSETNIEQIIALKPQIVIMTKMGQTVEQVAALENAGIKVFASDAQKIEDVYIAIELIGTITGKKVEADSVVSDMEKAFSEIEAKVSGEGEKTVYFEVSPLEWGLWTAANGTFMDELATMLGLSNIFSDVSGWAEVSQEQVIERNPDYIVTISMYFGEGPTPVEEIKGRKGWENLTAVKNDQILNADQNEISLPGPRLVNGAASLYEFIYNSK
jgi:iron complex transport system substrate-binding protein